MAKRFSARELTPQDAAEYIQSTPGLQLVDVRQPDEHKEAHIAKCKLIPLGTLPVRAHELDKNKPVLFHCAAGGRSGQALRFAEQEGFKEAKHILGGISGWAGAGLPYVS